MLLDVRLPVSRLQWRVWRGLRSPKQWRESSAPWTGRLAALRELPTAEIFCSTKSVRRPASPAISTCLCPPVRMSPPPFKPRAMAGWNASTRSITGYRQESWASRLNCHTGCVKNQVAVYGRATLWMLHSALALGSAGTTVIALWNGEPADGPGGVDDVVRNARSSGARVVILDTNKLFDPSASPSASPRSGAATS